MKNKNLKFLTKISFLDCYTTPHKKHHQSSPCLGVEAAPAARAARGAERAMPAPPPLRDSAPAPLPEDFSPPDCWDRMPPTWAAAVPAAPPMIWRGSSLTIRSVNLQSGAVKSAYALSNQSTDSLLAVRWLKLVSSQFTYSQVSSFTVRSFLLQSDQFLYSHAGQFIYGQISSFTVRTVRSVHLQSGQFIYSQVVSFTVRSVYYSSFFTVRLVNLESAPLLSKGSVHLQSGQLLYSQRGQFIYSQVSSFTVRSVHFQSVQFIYSQVSSFTVR